MDRSLPFEVRRFRGGLHSMRDLPSKILLARSHIGAERYDVVHAADWPFFIPVALSRSLTQARILMTVHGTEINETQTPLKRLAIRTVGVFGSRTEIAANSRYTRELFRERFAVDSRRIHAIRLGVSDFWFGPRNGRAATRAALGIAPDRIVIVTVARITRRKGHPVTLAALSTLPRELRRRITWLVIGPDGEHDYVQQLKRLVTTVDCDIRFLGATAGRADPRHLWCGRLLLPDRRAGIFRPGRRVRPCLPGGCSRRPAKRSDCHRRRSRRGPRR